MSYYPNSVTHPEGPEYDDEDDLGACPGCGGRLEYQAVEFEVPDMENYFENGEPMQRVVGHHTEYDAYIVCVVCGRMFEDEDELEGWRYQNDLMEATRKDETSAFDTALDEPD